MLMVGKSAFGEGKVIKWEGLWKLDYTQQAILLEAFVPLREHTRPSEA